MTLSLKTAQFSQLSYLGTSQGSLLVYFSQGAGEPGLTPVLSCIIRVAHSQSQARGGDHHRTTVVGRTLHSSKVSGVTWTFDFPEDLSFNLPLTKHLLAVISKKYVWDCQIFDI